MGGISIWQIIIIVVFLPIFVLPSIIAVKKGHRHKTPIILVNILGGFLWGIGWIVALVWCFIEPSGEQKSKENVAIEIKELHELKEQGVITDCEFKSRKKLLLEN